MIICFHGPEDTDIARLKQTLMFHMSRFDLNVTTLHFELQDTQSDCTQHEYGIVLYRPRAGKQSPKLAVTASSLQLLIQRLADRLEHPLYECQIEQVPAYKYKVA